MEETGGNAVAKEAADQPMISWRDREQCEARGIELHWGEYYVLGSDNDGSYDCDDGDEESETTIEEADEATDEQLKDEIYRAWCLVGEETVNRLDDVELANEVMYVTMSDSTQSSTPTLMGMPETLLEKIFQYAMERPSEVCTLERVCKRFHRTTRDDDFWDRHPRFADTRAQSLVGDCIRQIKIYQGKTENQILAVLGDGDPTGVADAVRDVVADLLSRMIHLGTGVQFRLRGDAIGYLVELLQSHMIEFLRGAVFYAIHGHRNEVRRADVMAYSQSSHCMYDCWGIAREMLPRCNVSTGEHRFGNSYLGCSCSLSSSSGTVWRWPSDDCHGVLPPEAGRRIIRRLAYQSSVREISNEAFVLAEAELLHTMGLLVVDAYELSVEMSKSASYLDADKALVYDVPTDSIDMFKVPPPPFCRGTDEGEEGKHLSRQLMYTIVPGQVKAAAERRNMLACSVYGDTWVASPGFTVEEEKATEKGYYYGAYDEDFSGGEFDKNKDIYSGKIHYEDNSDSVSCYSDSGSYSTGEDLDSSDDMDWEELKNVRSHRASQIEPGRYLSELI